MHSLGWFNDKGKFDPRAMQNPWVFNVQYEDTYPGTSPARDFRRIRNEDRQGRRVDEAGSR